MFFNIERPSDNLLWKKKIKYNNIVVNGLLKWLNIRQLFFLLYNMITTAWCITRFFLFLYLHCSLFLRLKFRAVFSADLQFFRLMSNRFESTIFSCKSYQACRWKSNYYYLIFFHFCLLVHGVKYVLNCHFCLI